LTVVGAHCQNTFALALRSAIRPIEHTRKPVVYYTSNTESALQPQASSIVAIGLEFIDVVIPIAKIRERYLGGWEQCLLDYAALLGRRIWYDRHLFRDGAMSLPEAQALVEGWAVLGFEPMEQRSVGLYWKDLCVVDWVQGGATLPCDWLSLDLSSRTAHLAGADPGPLSWRGKPSPGVH
jgi:hypothetical protein